MEAIVFDNEPVTQFLHAFIRNAVVQIPMAPIDPRSSVFLIFESNQRLQRRVNILQHWLKKDQLTEYDRTLAVSIITELATYSFFKEFFEQHNIGLEVILCPYELDRSSRLVEGGDIGIFYINPAGQYEPFLIIDVTLSKRSAQGYKQGVSYVYSAPVASLSLSEGVLIPHDGFEIYSAINEIIKKGILDGSIKFDQLHKVILDGNHSIADAILEELSLVIRECTKTLNLQLKGSGRKVTRTMKHSVRQRIAVAYRRFGIFVLSVMPYVDEAVVSEFHIPERVLEIRIDGRRLDKELDRKSVLAMRQHYVRRRHTERRSNSPGCRNT